MKDNNKKNILILHDSLGGGGAEKALLEILNKFDYDKFNVFLILYRKIGIHLSSVPDRINIKSIYPFGNRLLFEKIICHTPLKYVYEKFKLKKLISGKRFDTIISYMEGPGALMHSYILDRSDNNITWIHSDIKAFHWSKKFFPNLKKEEEFYNSVNTIVSVSEDAKNALESLYRISTKITIIENILDVSIIRQKAKEFSIPKENITICYVGRLTDIKRPDRFIKVISLLKKKNIIANGWIVGTGNNKYTKKMNQLANDLNVKENITFWGFQRNPYPFILNSDILLIPSDSEGFSIVMYEAFALGIPVVATKCSGPLSILKDGSGILCDFSEEDIANKIGSLINDKNLYLKQKALSKEKIAEINPDIIMNKINDLFK